MTHYFNTYQCIKVSHSHVLLLLVYVRFISIQYDDKVNDAD